MHRAVHQRAFYERPRRRLYRYVPVLHSLVAVALKKICQRAAKRACRRIIAPPTKAGQQDNTTMKMVTMMVIIPLALCHALVGTRAFSIAPTSSTRQFHDAVSSSVFGSTPTTARTPNNNRGIQFNAARFASSLWMAGSNANEEDEDTKRILSEVAELTANFEEVSRT
eukprot:scaffold21966_cov38-Attheya_sp.AAC.1